MLHRNNENEQKANDIGEKSKLCLVLVILSCQKNKQNIVIRFCNTVMITFFRIYLFSYGHEGNKGKKG